VVRDWDWIRVSVLAVCVALTGWALRLGTPAAPAAPPALAPEGDAVIYQAGLMPGWQDWSWAKHELQSVAVPFRKKSSIRMEPANFTGVYLHHDGLDTRGYTSLWLWVHGGTSGGQKLVVCAADMAGQFGPKVELGRNTVTGTIPPGRWVLATIPLQRLNARNTRITGFCVQEMEGKTQGAVYIGEMKLISSTPQTPKTYRIEIDTSRDVKPISPAIYGMAHTGEAVLKDLRLGSHRWGGNPNSRYNWEINAWNHARDWQFSNYGDPKPEARTAGVAIDGFVEMNNRAGVATVLTVPAIGWVAKDVNDSSRSVGVPPQGGMPVRPGSDAIAGYDPAENRRRTSVRSFARKSGAFRYPPDVSDGAVYQDEWVSHLVSRFGKANAGGVRFYAIDNEPDLWDGTHTDVRPARLGYDDLLSTFLEYATAVKAVDSTAQVMGPVSWGWTGYLHSPRDRDNWGSRPDRRAHGDMELIPWFLDQLRKHDQRTGKRTLDVLDVHFYPQGAGVYSDKSDPATNDVRIRSTRSLWDLSYKDESWIGESVRLIPRMQAWIKQYYPGTKLGLTEWNWGADGTLNGAVAIAECLGVFGKHGLTLANYWTAPKPQSPGYYAFKIYRNADDSGAGLGDKSVWSSSSTPDELSCFGSVDSKSGLPAAVVINKRPDRALTVTLAVKHTRPVSAASAWRYGGTNTRGIDRLSDVAVKSGSCTLTIPAYSITLLKFR
jgi:hypothetical protein